MSLPAEYAAAVAQFPPVLRTLIEAELAVGNTIEELGSGFPAPPVGAYVKLANKVSTQSRASSAGLSFYERNGSTYSGEFTDERRFYFVLEPANPPEPEPDMDAIRKALEAKSKVSTPRAHRTEDEAPAPPARPVSAAKQPTPRTEQRATNSEVLQQTLVSDESATGWTRVLHFRDQRSPYDVQFALERTLMSLFVPTIEDGRLVLRSTATVVGARYNFALCLEAALLRENCYSLRVDASWAAPSAANDDYYRKSSVSWFEMWTRDLVAANPPDADEGSSERYRKLADDTMKAESALDSVGSIQQCIMQAMKRGESFRFSDKEGTTSIFWRDGRFIRDDQGEFPNYRVFNAEAEFLLALRQICDMSITRNMGRNKPSDFDAWKLILRLLRE